MDEKLKSKKISAISLGCDKNRVDLEKMLFRLKEYGFEIVDDPQNAQIVIVNTCAFITPSKEEALNNIFEMLHLKECKKLEKVLVSGCLAQRHKEELVKQIPEVDAYLIEKDNANICQIIEKLYDVKASKYKDLNGRVFTNRGSYAYLKIADGCSNACSYCTIPRIKGRYRSFEMNDLVKEAKYLADQGVKELVLVAQDITRYGEDLYGKNCLIDLLKKLAKIDQIKWIRLHYLYPEKTSDELLDYIEKEPKICKYIDIPLQHIDNRILKEMRRRLGENQTRNLITKLKTKYHNIYIRTTFIVGFPSESGKDFKKLCEFVKDSKFDYAGFFPYYREENTPSYFMKKQVAEWKKRKRLKKIVKIQQKISLEKAKSLIGQEFTVLIDYFDEIKGVYVGHSEFLSPTVDFGVEIVDNNKIKAGDFVKVKFEDFDGENFKGECYESTK